MNEQTSENIRLLKGFYHAISRGDMESIRAALAPEVDWIEPKESGLWFSGPHNGAETVVEEVILSIKSKVDKLRVKVKHLFPVGERIIVLGYFRGYGWATGKTLDAPTMHVVLVKHGKIARLEAMHDAYCWREILPESELMAA